MWCVEGGAGLTEADPAGQTVLSGVSHTQTRSMCREGRTPSTPLRVSRAPLAQAGRETPSWALGHPAVGAAVEGGSRASSRPDPLGSVLTAFRPGPGGVGEDTTQPRTVRCLAGEVGRCVESGKGTQMVSSAPPHEPQSPRCGPKEKPHLRAYLGAVRPPRASGTTALPSGAATVPSTPLLISGMLAQGLPPSLQRWQGWEGAPGSDARPHFLCPFSQRPGVAGLPLDLTPCSGHLRGGRKGSWVPEGASERLAQAHRLPLRRGMKVMFMMCGDPRSPPAVRQASCGDGARPPPGSLSSAGLS